MSNQNEQQFVAPQGVMSMKMTAPSGFEGKTKRTDIQIFPDGPQPAVIYCVIGLGTHTENYQGTGEKDINKIYIGFEFPQLKQLFYVEDTEPRSTIMSIESSYSMGPKSKLRAVCEAAIGRKFNGDNEAYNYDVSQLIGAKVLVNVITKYRKADNTPYNSIGSVIPLGSYPLPPNFNPEIEYNVFGIDQEGNNFKTMNYAKVPLNLKKIILESKEAKDYIARGGVFAKLPDNYQQTQTPQQSYPATPAPPTPAPAPVQNAGPKFVLLDTQFTLEQWKAANWTEEMLVQNGKGKWEYPTPPSPSQMAPPPAAPAAPAPPQAPLSSQPLAQQVELQQQAQDWLSEDDDDDDCPF